jgi:hypothetical protein
LLKSHAGLPLVGCPRLLIEYIRIYLSYRRLYLHPRTEDAPCRGDRDPSQGIRQLSECSCLVGTSAAREYKNGCTEYVQRRSHLSIWKWNMSPFHTIQQFTLVPGK